MDERGGRSRTADGKRLALAALGIYTGLSLAFFGWRVLGHFSRTYVGSGADPTITMWALAWWPYALRHGINPFFTDRVWAPQGTSLAWMTGVPGASLAVAPITLWAGPVAAYNILSLLAPALAAWTAYLVCRQLTKRFWASVVGGYIFGFSPYEIGHLRGHLNLMLIFLIPLAVYLVLLLLLDEVMKPWAFVLLLGGVLVTQFLFSNEIFASLSVFGAVTLGFAHLLFPGDLKPRLRSASVLILCAYGIAAAALSPYLYSIVARGIPRVPINDPEVYSTDLLNMVIPTPLTLGGPAFNPITRAFSGNYAEEGAYLGLPLLLVVALFARAHWQRPGGKLLCAVLGIIALASLGPALHIAGHRIVSLPWKLALVLPVLNNALPGRFTAYAFLAAAIIVAIWLSAAGPAAAKKWALVSLGAILLLPNLWYPGWAAPAHTPAFITDQLYRAYLHEGENVLVIPYGANGNGMLWQAEAGLYFRMVGGWTGSAPRDFFRWPIIYTLYSGQLIPDYAAQLRAYLAAHAVHEIVVVEGTPGPWPQLFASLETEPKRIGGVTLYQVPERLLSTAGGPLAPLEMERRSNLALAGSLIAAANHYVSRRIAIASLTPLDAEQRGLLPRYWGGYVASEANARQGLEFSTRTGLRLGPWEADTIGVGLIGSAQAIGPLIARYGSVAQRLYFPYPHPLGDLVRGEGVLLMVFTRDGIQRAAAMPQ
jgi:hypothetical protein